MHVDIIDVGTEYKISVSNGPSGGIMSGKVEPFSTATTRGLHRRILDWLGANYARHGLRLGFIYYTTVSQGHPKCRSCRHGTRDVAMTRGGRRSAAASSALPAYCDECGGAGVVMPGFSE